MKRIIFAILCVLMTFSLLCSCESFIKDRQIEDTNGESNNSVVSITDEDICKGNYGQVSLKSHRSNSNGEIKQSAELFSGIMTLDEINTNDELLTIKAEPTLNSGNLRIVVVYDKEIVGELSVTEPDELSFENASGRYSLLAVGESANFEISVTVKKSK